MEITKKRRKHFELEDIEVFIRFNEVPKSITDWGVRSNFKRVCKKLFNREWPAPLQKQTCSNYGEA